MAQAGYNTVINVTGTSTAFTTEAFTGATTTWQITSTSTRIWDPTVTPSFFDNAVPILAADISSIDFLFGRVVFTGSKTGPITATGSYLPVWPVAEAKEFSAQMSRTILDTTVFTVSDTWKTKKAGLKEASGTISSLDDLNTDIDTGGTSRKLFDVLLNATGLVLDIQPGGSGNKWRYYILLDKEDLKAAVDDLVNSEISWQLNPQTATRGDAVSFSYGT
jgi:hypothetical protein